MRKCKIDQYYTLLLYSLFQERPPMDLFKAIFAESSSDSSDSDAEGEEMAATNNDVADSPAKTRDAASGVATKERKWQDLSVITSTLLPATRLPSGQSHGDTSNVLTSAKNENAPHAESEGHRDGHTNHRQGFARDGGARQGEDEGREGTSQHEEFAQRQQNLVHRHDNTHRRDSTTHRHSNGSRRRSTSSSRRESSSHRRGSWEGSREGDDKELECDAISSRVEGKDGGAVGLDVSSGKDGPSLPASYGPALPSGIENWYGDVMYCVCIRLCHAIHCLFDLISNNLN